MTIHGVHLAHDGADGVALPPERHGGRVGGDELAPEVVVEGDLLAVRRDALDHLAGEVARDLHGAALAVLNPDHVSHEVSFDPSYPSVAKSFLDDAPGSITKEGIDLALLVGLGEQPPFSVVALLDTVAVGMDDVREPGQPTPLEARRLPVGGGDRDDLLKTIVVVALDPSERVLDLNQLASVRIGKTKLAAGRRDLPRASTPVVVLVEVDAAIGRNALHAVPLRVPLEGGTAAANIDPVEHFSPWSVGERLHPAVLMAEGLDIAPPVAGGEDPAAGGVHHLDLSALLVANDGDLSPFGIRLAHHGPEDIELATDHAAVGVFALELVAGLVQLARGDPPVALTALVTPPSERPK